MSSYEQSLADLDELLRVTVGDAPETPVVPEVAEPPKAAKVTPPWRLKHASEAASKPATVADPRLAAKAAKGTHLGSFHADLAAKASACIAHTRRMKLERGDASSSVKLDQGGKSISAKLELGCKSSSVKLYEAFREQVAAATAVPSLIERMCSPPPKAPSIGKIEKSSKASVAPPATAKPPGPPAIAQMPDDMWADWANRYHDQQSAQPSVPSEPSEPSQHSELDESSLPPVKRQRGPRGGAYHRWMSAKIAAKGNGRAAELDFMAKNPYPEDRKAACN